jgi:hypothetical protein
MTSHYAALGVNSKASFNEIRRAYYRISLSNHLDKTSQLSEGEKAQRADRFKAASAACEVFGDAEKRLQYDAGNSRHLPVGTTTPTRSRTVIGTRVDSRHHPHRHHRFLQVSHHRCPQELEYKNPPPAVHPASSAKIFTPPGSLRL